MVQIYGELLLFATPLASVFGGAFLVVALPNARRRQRVKSMSMCPVATFFPPPEELFRRLDGVASSRNSYTFIAFYLIGHAAAIQPVSVPFLNRTFRTFSISFLISLAAAAIGKLLCLSWPKFTQTSMKQTIHSGSRRFALSFFFLLHHLPIAKRFGSCALYYLRLKMGENELSPYRT